ncbi:molybdopterin-dependent oxidoreductase [Candidatus Bathyarchaeota archaeon]|nr:molybdopterin-dependent oxidoreductase [Candidatus Bathyarchaeota archaeon]
MNRSIIPFSIGLIIIAGLLIGIFWLNQPPPIVLDGVEIREYEGKMLSSVEDFRENSIKGPQYLEIDTYSLSFLGLNGETSELTYSQIVTELPAYKKIVTLYCVEGWKATILWEGVLVEDLIKKTGVSLEGEAVIFYAADGYSTALPKDYLIENKILLAYRMNNVTLPDERGFPFQLVAESKYGYKWIKWVTKIEMSNNTNYLGFWESQGYPNDADLPDDVDSYFP